MRVRINIQLSEKDRSKLNQWANSGRTEQRLAMRARIILLSVEGHTLAEIAAHVGVTRKIVSLWRRRFFEMGIDGLKDMPGRGRPKIYGPEERVDILALACTKPPDGSTKWSVRKLAKATGKSKTFVNDLLNAAIAKPSGILHIRVSISEKCESQTRIFRKLPCGVQCPRGFCNYLT